MRFAPFLATLAVATALAARPAAAAPAAPPPAKPFRPPAVPLVTHNPYLSIWSEADLLTDDVTRHWTHHPHSLVSLLRVDGKAYRLMGKEPAGVPAFPQASVKVLPTRSVYEFDDSHVHVTLTFMTAALPDDLDALALPLSYLTWQVRSADGAAHEAQLYQSTSSQLAVFSPEQRVQWGREEAGPLTALRVGSEEQPVLQRMGDDTRIDWGHAYAAAPSAQAKAAIGPDAALAKEFAEQGTLPARDDARMPRAVRDEQPVLAFAFDLGRLAPSPAGDAAAGAYAAPDAAGDGRVVTRTLMVAYDEGYSIKYFGKRLRPYWRRNGATAAAMLQNAARDYPALARRCEAFDRELMADLTRAGGERYAQVAALAYRQTFAACGLVADANGKPLLLTKENTSNGDIATVDVFYPMDPIFVALSPTLAKATLVSVLDYSASDHWKFPNAPHDLGTYPVIMGRDDGGEGMPVEESGNMLLLVDAIARAEGNADFAAKWWPQLTQWAKYLEQYGLDPENQLCTDDFMGHLAHNANLSVKAILGLAAYGDLCKMRGDEAEAKRYADLAKADARHWMKVAAEGGPGEEHYRLAFDKPNTWSQKYNLVWDRLLGLNVFPPEVARQEVAFYKGRMQKYGVPLDSRTKLTKTDWSLWSATLAEDQADFEALVAPIYDYLDQTPARDPLADSYVTDNVRSHGMHARPVVGGIFVKLLAYPDIWKKWAGRDLARNAVKPTDWAPLPTPPKVSEVVPTARQQAATWRYTTRKPAEGWAKPDFDDQGWKPGPSGFGTRGTPGAVVNTHWNTADIWLRRPITLPAGEHPNLQFLVYHDEDVEIYVDGVLAATESGFASTYQVLEIRPLARKLLKPGATVMLAVHCHQTEGGQAVDVGLADVEEAK